MFNFFLLNLHRDDFVVKNNNELLSNLGVLSLLLHFSLIQVPQDSPWLIYALLSLLIRPCPSAICILLNLVSKQLINKNSLVNFRFDY